MAAVAVYMLKAIRAEHHFKSFEQLPPINLSIRILVNGPNGLYGLGLRDYSIDVEVFEQLVEKLSHLLNIKSPVPVSIVLVEDRVYIVPDHLVLDVCTLHTDNNYLIQP